jgi:uncharacterized protein with FMN-binding domain
MKRNHRIIWGVVMVTVFVAAFSITKIISRIEANLKRLENLKVQNVDLSKMPDGIYSGSYNVFPVTADVRVIVKNHKIAEIELVKHTNGKGAAAEVIPERVVKAQSIEIDVVTGATYSSKVILKSIENALNSAYK